MQWVKTKLIYYRLLYIIDAHCLYKEIYIFFFVGSIQVRMSLHIIFILLVCLAMQSTSGSMPFVEFFD